MTLETNLVKDSVVNPFIDVNVKKSAECNITVSQTEESTFHMISLVSRLAEKSLFNYESFNTDNELMRQDTELHFNGEEAAGYLNGLSILSNEKKHFHHIVVHHHVKNCFCDVAVLSK